MAATREPEIRGWLLREGFRNSVMDEYLAYTCAMAGELHTALAAPTIDEPLFRGAAGILRALANGGPAQDLADYPHTAASVSAFLDHLAKRPLDLELLATLDALSARKELSGPLRERLEATRRSDLVGSLIDAGLASSDEAQLRLASLAAGVRGIDTFPWHEARVRAGHLDGSLFPLMRATSPARLERALDATAPHVPLTSIASGPALEAGRGPAFAPHRYLDIIVQELARFPGKGVAFLGAALQSPVVRNRTMALRALSAWTKPSWPTPLAVALDRAIVLEPDPELKRAMERVRAGGALDEREERLDESDDDGSVPPPLLH